MKHAPGAKVTWTVTLIIIVTVAAFLPALGHGFVTWDDNINFLDNVHYRGLGIAQLQWMWSTFLMGHYQPLSWMTLGADYVAWGMDARGYHLTNVVLHCGNAVLVFVLAKRILGLAAADHEERIAETRKRGGSRGPAAQPSFTVGATVAALLFAVHPLRVESVAWVTERRDVLSGLFFWSAILTYLRHAVAFRDGSASASASPTRRIHVSRWYAATLALFAAALLSKATTITLPAVLALLNIYPLRRVGGTVGWRWPALKPVFLELAPLGIIALADIPLTLTALAPPDQFTLGAKLAVSAYSLAFYLFKTLIPTGLSPLYAMPAHVDPWQARFLMSTAVVIALAVSAILLRGRWPGAVLALACFVVITLPMLGLVQNGPQIAADRYTYHAAPALAILAGGWLAGVRRNNQAIARTVAALIIVVFAVLTWRQTLAWRDSRTFWAYVLSRDANSAIAETAMGSLDIGDRNFAHAIEHLSRATTLDSTYAEAHDNLGIALAAVGRVDEAIVEYRKAIARDGRRAEAHNNLGIALARQGHIALAIDEYATALALNSDYADAHVNWGNALVRSGRVAEAIDHYRDAVRARPDLANAHVNWGAALAQESRFGEAIGHFRMALAIDPANADAARYLSAAEGLVQARQAGAAR